MTGGRRDDRVAAQAHHDDVMTIAELSRRTGMTVRNIRAHQSRGLLPPPRRQGRLAVYDEAHAARISRIQQLQRRGFNLAAIRALIVAEQAGDVGRQLQRLALAPLLRHEPLVVDRADLGRTYRFTSPDDGMLRGAVEHGLARDLGDGRVELTSRQLAASGHELVARGLPAAAVLELQTSFIDAVGEVARRFVDLCVQRAWEPFEADGYPAERWNAVTEEVEDLLDQMSLVVMSTFSLTVRAAAEQRLQDKAPPAVEDAS